VRWNLEKSDFSVIRGAAEERAAVSKAISGQTETLKQKAGALRLESGSLKVS
jgi:hypothetical protein